MSLTGHMKISAVTGPDLEPELDRSVRADRLAAECRSAFHDASFDPALLKDTEAAYLHPTAGGYGAHDSCEHCVDSGASLLGTDASSLTGDAYQISLRRCPSRPLPLQQGLLRSVVRSSPVLLAQAH